MPQSLPTAYVHNLAATGAPTATDDASKGYVVGSLWINVSGNTAYICTVNTTGAVTWLAI